MTLLDRSSKTAPKPFVFVLMPFDKAFDDVYKLGIRAACERAGAYCERVDEQHFKELILQRIYNQIAKADLIVADMSGRNPNVFYEVGYAHALDKEVVLLTRSADDIPFDLKLHPHIIYGNSICDLLDKLAPRILSSLISEQPDVEFTIGGRKLEDGCSITTTVREPNEAGITRVKIDLHNPSNRSIDLGPGALAVVVKNGVKLRVEAEPISVPEGVFYRLPPLGRLLPTAYESITLEVAFDRLPAEEIESESDDPYIYLTFEREKHLELELRHLQEHGPRSISVALALRTY